MEAVLRCNCVIKNICKVNRKNHCHRIIVFSQQKKTRLKWKNKKKWIKWNKWANNKERERERERERESMKTIFQS